MIHDMFRSKYPRSSELNVEPVNGTEGFDLPDVLTALGAERAAGFEKYLSNKSVFVCGHRTAPVKVGAGDDERTIEAEVHCCYARDLEAFLAEGGN